MTVRDIQYGSKITQNDLVGVEGAQIFSEWARVIRGLEKNPEFANGGEPILTSPDGTRYRLTVDNAGNLGTVLA